MSFKISHLHVFNRKRSSDIWVILTFKLPESEPTLKQLRYNIHLFCDPYSNWGNFVSFSEYSKSMKLNLSFLWRNFGFYEILRHIYFTDVFSQQRIMTEKRQNLHYTPKSAKSRRLGTSCLKQGVQNGAILNAVMLLYRKIPLIRPPAFKPLRL